MQCPAELRRYADQIASSPVGAGGDNGGRSCKAFVDIGGDRESGAVVRMIFAVVDALAPGLIVVKSRNLFAALVPHVAYAPAATASPAVGPANATWLAAMRALAAPGPDDTLPSREPARLSRQARRAARRATSASEFRGEGGGGGGDPQDCSSPHVNQPPLFAPPDGSSWPEPATPNVVPPLDGA